MASVNAGSKRSRRRPAHRATAATSAPRPAAGRDPDRRGPGGRSLHSRPGCENIAPKPPPASSASPAATASSNIRCAVAAAVQLVQLAAFPRHLPQQPLRLGLQAAMDGRLLVRLEEVVVGRFQNLVQALDGVAVMALIQPLAPWPICCKIARSAGRKRFSTSFFAAADPSPSPLILRVDPANHSPYLRGRRAAGRQDRRRPRPARIASGPCLAGDAGSLDPSRASRSAAL